MNELASPPFVNRLDIIFSYMARHSHIIYKAYTHKVTIGIACAVACVHRLENECKKISK